MIYSEQNEGLKSNIYFYLCIVFYLVVINYINEGYD